MAKRKPAKKGAGSGKKLNLKMKNEGFNLTMTDEFFTFKIPDLSNGSITVGPNVHVEVHLDGSITVSCP
jgi:hypothetical protein